MSKLSKFLATTSVSLLIAASPALGQVDQNDQGAPQKQDDAKKQGRTGATCEFGDSVYAQGLHISLGTTSYECNPDGDWALETKRKFGAACVYANALYSQGAKLPGEKWNIQTCNEGVWQ